MAQSAIAARVHRQQSPPEIVHVRKPSSPHFMSPTIASKLSQANGPETRASTPVSIKSVKSDRGQSLLQSAVQRVGRRRAATNDTTRGNNRSPIKYGKVVSFPDKLSTPSYTKASTFPPTTSSTKDEMQQISPLDKPLPALPKIQPKTVAIESSASFVERDNKSNQSSTTEISSPEERAALEPSQALSSESLRSVMAKSGQELVKQSSLNERYPKLGNTTLQHQSPPHRPIVSRYSPKSQQMRKEEFSGMTPEPPSSTGALQDTAGMSDPFDIATGTTNFDPIVGKDQNLSAAAAALEKSATEIRMDQNPRQTRTSSLRARLSAGQLVKDSQNKILGFTDFTVSRTSIDSLVDSNRHDSFSVRKEPSVNHLNNSLNSPVHGKVFKPSLQKKTSVQSLHSNLSTESLVKGHAPAQFVGGSRRAIQNTRPTSRNGNRNISHGSYQIPVSRHSQTTTPLPGKTSVSNNEDPAIEQAKMRKSSLPVPTHVALNAMYKPNISKTVGRKSPQANVTPKKASHDETAVHRDSPSAELLSDFEIGPKSPFKNRGATQIFNDAMEYRSLAAIEESPQQVFTLKRLSAKAPEYGPKLRISPSAERFIMGHDSDKENQLVSSRSTKSLFQRATNGIHKQQRNGGKVAPAYKRRPDRPVSSHGILQSSPRVPRFESHVRERKVKSADMSSTLSSNLAAAPDPSRQNTDASKESRPLSKELSFVSAEEEYSQHTKKDPKDNLPHKDPHAIIEEASWISGAKEKTNESSLDPPSNDSSSVTPRNASSRDNIQPENVLLSSPPKVQNSDANNNITPKRSTSNATFKQNPFTPLDTIGKISSRPSRRHPPRSSSLAQPNFTTPPSSGSEKLEKHSPTPPKDENRQENIQNSLGSRHGHASWQVDIADLKSQRISSLQEKLIHEQHESTSTPISAKKSFSSFRNLFNKRSPATEHSNPRPSKGSPSKPSTKAKHPKSKSKSISTLSISSPYTPLISNQTPPNQHMTPASSFSSTPSPPKSTPTTIRKSPLTPGTLSTPVTTTATPISLASPTPTPLSKSSNLAMSLLDAALAEDSSPKKEKLIQMSSILVDAITQARDAEKAAEEAKIASRKAEMAKEICGRMVEEVGRVVGEWSAAMMERGNR